MIHLIFVYKIKHQVKDKEECRKILKYILKNLKTKGFLVEFHYPSVNQKVFKKDLYSNIHIGWDKNNESW
jgi:phospholipid N-methyltransferase